LKNNQLASESVSRRIYTTTDTIETVKGNEYFNPFKFRLSVDDVVIVKQMKEGKLVRRHQLIVTQIDPFVKTTDYMDYDERIKALESAVAGLSGVPVAEVSGV